MNSLLALATQDTTLRHAASTGGGEWCGPCPGCGGCDRFRMWPEKGRYWCRGCNKKGDAILRDFRGLSFREAARRVGKNLGPYQPKPAADLLWRYLEEQYEVLREELTMVQRASLAIPSRDLRVLVRECIDRHIDREVLSRVQLVEKSERATLLHYTRSLTAELEESVQ